MRAGSGIVAGVDVAALAGPAAEGGILDVEAAAFEVLLVVQFDGFGCGGDVCVSYVAESGGGCEWWF